MLCDCCPQHVLADVSFKVLTNRRCTEELSGSAFFDDLQSDARGRELSEY